MKDYKISIKAEHTGTYSANSIEEAEEIAQTECDNAYSRLKGRYSVEIESIEEKK